MAAGDVLIRAGTTVQFGGTGADVPWTTLLGITGGQGAQSAQHDLGDESTTPRANLYRVRFWIQASAGTLAVGEAFDLYLKTSDDPNLRSDNDLGNGDLAMTTAGDIDKLNNLTFVGSAIVDQGATATEFVLSVPEVLINSRYINWVCWNSTGGTVTSTAADAALQMTPIIYQGQSA